MATPRCASVLLLCLAILAAMVVLAFAFVHSLQLNQTGGAAHDHLLLAREAALAGRNHALEQIIHGYVREPLTRLDGPAFAPFAALVNPAAVSDNNVAARIIGRDDVSAEHPVYASQFLGWGGSGYGDTTAPFNYGWTTWDGRGRYVQPGFLNRVSSYLAANGEPDPAVTSPITPVVFGTVPASIPDIHSAAMYDERLHRIAGAALVARAQARLRQRYAVGVIDLDGEILFSPEAALDYRRITEADPSLLPTTAIPARPDEQARPGYAAGSYRPDTVQALYTRVVRGGHAIPAMIIAWAWFGDVDPQQKLRTGGPERAGHVFLGRGFSNNVDLDPSRGNGPVTFPLMYRNVSDRSSFSAWRNDNAANGVWVADNFFPGTQPIGTKAGGMPIATGNTMYHVGTGAPWSFKALDNACDSQGAQGVYDLGPTSMGSLTPFGRGLLLQHAGSTYRASLDATLDQAPDRWHGTVDTPWCVNLLTAPTQVIFGMLAAYVPPSPFYANYTYPSTSGKSFAPQPLRVLRDLFVPQMSPAFASYQSPARLGPDIVQPDYHLGWLRNNEPAWRAPANRYPGEVAYNGFEDVAAPKMVFDDLGRWLRTTDSGAGRPRQWPVRDPFTGRWLWINYRNFGGNYTGIAYDRPFKVDVNGNHIFDDSGGLNQTYACYSDSIWNAVGEAFTATAAVARGQWLQFANANTDPTTLFNANGAPLSPRIKTVDDLDRLFLRNLGIDRDNPTAPPVTAWAGNDAGGGSKVQLTGFTPLFNPALLRAAPPAGFAINLVGDSSYDSTKPSYTAAERTAVMELIINDVRMSFFGASPGYCTTFRPLDLDGDGLIRCSAYVPVINADATLAAREKKLHLDQYAITPTAPANPFSLTGCFFLGRSHFYRIITRGELWDDLRQTAVSTTVLDSVVCVDPGDEARDGAAAGIQHPERQYGTHLIYQRYWSDLYRGDMARSH